MTKKEREQLFEDVRSMMRESLRESAFKSEADVARERDKREREQREINRKIGEAQERKKQRQIMQDDRLKQRRKQFETNRGRILRLRTSSSDQWNRLASEIEDCLLHASRYIPEDAVGRLRQELSDETRDMWRLENSFADVD